MQWKFFILLCVLGLVDNKTQYTDGEEIEVYVVMRNIGKYDQYEVPQLYVHRVDAKVEWPYKELKAFRKVQMKAGDAASITLTVPVESLKYWDENKHDWVLEPGKIELLVARNAGEIVGKLEVEIR